MNTTETAPAVGHNSGQTTVTVEARLFNRLARYAPSSGSFQTLRLPVGSTVGDVIRQLKLPLNEVFLVLLNGRDVTPGIVGAAVRTEVVLDDGDVVALSGPVPYSYGYGAPVV